MRHETRQPSYNQIEGKDKKRFVSREYVVLIFQIYLTQLILAIISYENQDDTI